MYIRILYIYIVYMYIIYTSRFWVSTCVRECVEYLFVFSRPRKIDFWKFKRLIFSLDSAITNAKHNLDLYWWSSRCPFSVHYSCVVLKHRSKLRIQSEFISGFVQTSRRCVGPGQRRTVFVCFASRSHPQFRAPKLGWGVNRRLGFARFFLHGAQRVYTKRQETTQRLGQFWYINILSIFEPQTVVICLGLFGWDSGYTTDD